jgi:hypothetical protein
MIVHKLAPSLLLSPPITSEITLATRHRRRHDLTGVSTACGSCQILPEINPYRLSIDGPPSGRRRVLQSPIDNQLDKAPVGFNIGRVSSNGSRRRNVNRSIKLRRRINGLSIIN